MLKPSEEWFKQAQYDLNTAEALFQAERYIYVVFMCHLAVEKALKGLYTRKFEKEPPKVHDLIFLTAKIGLDLPEDKKAFLKRINELSVPTRYPETLDRLLREYDTKRTKDVLLQAKELVEWLVQRLEK